MHKTHTLDQIPCLDTDFSYPHRPQCGTIVKAKVLNLLAFKLEEFIVPHLKVLIKDQ